MYRCLFMIGVIVIAVCGSQRAHADTNIPDLPTVSRSLTLVDAIEVALQNNLTLRQAQSDADVASAVARSALSATKPSVAATAYGLGGNATNIVASSPGVMPQNYLIVPPNTVFDQNVIAMVPLFTGGKLEGQVRSAREQANGMALTWDEANLGVKQQTVEAYVGVLLDGALLDAARARLKAEDEQVRVTEENVKVGRSAPVDLMREQAEQANGNQAVLAAENDQAQAFIDLKVVLGVSLSSDISLSDTLDAIHLPQAQNPTSLADAMTLAERQRPDLIAALHEIDAANASVVGVRGSFSPQVYAVGMADASAISGGGNSAGYTVGLEASLPLYDAGQRHGDVDAAKGRFDRAVADAQSVRQSIDRQVASAWLSMQTATQAVESAKTGVNAAQKAYDLEDMRYNAGKSVASQRLDALASLTRAKGDMANAKASVLISRARLLSAVGSSDLY